MSIRFPVLVSRDIEYPDSDGQPIAANTLQFEWVVTIEGGLEALFRDREDVFVAGDLLWYPVEGRPDIRVASDGKPFATYVELTGSGRAGAAAGPRRGAGQPARGAAARAGG